MKSRAREDVRRKRQWDRRPTVLVEQILEELAQHAQADPEWLEIPGCA
jgi:hypothetical protein